MLSEDIDQVSRGIYESLLRKLDRIIDGGNRKASVDIFKKSHRQLIEWEKYGKETMIELTIQKG